MGLDQYLSAKRSLSRYVEEEAKISKKIAKLFNFNLEVENVSFEVFYWRKANAIHKWFVDNVQEGEDDCKEYFVSLEDLQKLLDTINNALGINATNKEKIINFLSKEEKEKLAAKYLPSHSGFFFGVTEYDDYYFDILKKTKEMLEKLLENKEIMKSLNFYYSSSW